MSSQGQVFFKEINKSESGEKEINMQQCKWQFWIKMDWGKSMGYRKFCLCVGKSHHRFAWALSKYSSDRAFSETDFRSQRHKHVNCVCQPLKHHSEETQPCFWYFRKELKSILTQNWTKVRSPDCKCCWTLTCHLEQNFVVCAFL